MKPFAVIEHKGHIFKTGVSQHGHLPVWNYEFEIRVDSLLDEIKFYILDDKMMHKEKVGFGVARIG